MGCPVTYVMESAAPTYVERTDQRGQRTPVRCAATHLVVDGVPLGNQHAVNAPALARGGARKVTQRTVEFGQLVNGFITYQGFSDEKDLVWGIDGDEL